MFSATFTFAVAPPPLEVMTGAVLFRVTKVFSAVATVPLAFVAVMLKRIVRPESRPLMGALTFWAVVPLFGVRVTGTEPVMGGSPLGPLARSRNAKTAVVALPRGLTVPLIVAPVLVMFVAAVTVTVGTAPWKKTASTDSSMECPRPWTPPLRVKPRARSSRFCESGRLSPLSCQST